MAADELAAYAARFPDEELPAPAPASAMRCAAVVVDHEGRVLQLKDRARRVWLFPSEPVLDGDRSLAAVATRALESWCGPLGSTPDAAPLDVAAEGGEVVVSYVFRGGDLARLVPEAAARARLAPCDTLVNERLGTKLATG